MSNCGYFSRASAMICPGSAASPPTARRSRRSPADRSPRPGAGRTDGLRARRIPRWRHSARPQETAPAAPAVARAAAARRRALGGRRTTGEQSYDAPLNHARQRGAPGTVARSGPALGPQCREFRIGQRFPQLSAARRYWHISAIAQVAGRSCGALTTAGSAARTITIARSAASGAFAPSSRALQRIKIVGRRFDLRPLTQFERRGRGEGNDQACARRRRGDPFRGRGRWRPMGQGAAGDGPNRRRGRDRRRAPAASSRHRSRRAHPPPRSADRAGPREPAARHPTCRGPLAPASQARTGGAIDARDVIGDAAHIAQVGQKPIEVLSGGRRSRRAHAVALGGQDAAQNKAVTWRHRMRRSNGEARRAPEPARVPARRAPAAWPRGGGGTAIASCCGGGRARGAGAGVAVGGDLDVDRALSQSARRCADGTRAAAARQERLSMKYAAPANTTAPTPGRREPTRHGAYGARPRARSDPARACARHVDRLDRGRAMQASHRQLCGRCAGSTASAASIAASNVCG